MEYKLVDILLVLFILLQLADFYTTYTVIRTGKGSEGNPVLSWLFGKIGYVPGLFLIKGAMIIGAFYITNLSNVEILLGIIDLVYIWVIINNFKVLKK